MMPSVRSTKWIGLVVAIACVVTLNLTALFIVKREIATTKYIEQNRTQISKNEAAIVSICKLLALQEDYYNLGVVTPPPGDTPAKFVARIALQQYLAGLAETRVCKNSRKNTTPSLPNP